MSDLNNDELEFIYLAKNVVRRVQTPEGSRFYGLPMGAIITADIIKKKKLEAKAKGVKPPKGALSKGDTSVSTGGTGLQSQVNPAPKGPKPPVDAPETPAAPTPVVKTPDNQPNVVSPTIKGSNAFRVGETEFTAPAGSKLFRPKAHPDVAYVLTPSGTVHAFNASGEVEINDPTLSRLLVDKFSKLESSDSLYSKEEFDQKATKKLSDSPSGDTLTKNGEVAFTKSGEGVWTDSKLGAQFTDDDLQPAFDSGKFDLSSVSVDEADFSKMSAEEVESVLEGYPDGKKIAYGDKVLSKAGNEWKLQDGTAFSSKEIAVLADDTKLLKDTPVTKEKTDGEGKQGTGNSGGQAGVSGVSGSGGGNSGSGGSDGSGNPTNEEPEPLDEVHGGFNVPGDLLKEAIDLVDQGRIIGAVKALRAQWEERNGYDLSIMEAKSVLDSIVEKHAFKVDGKRVYTREKFGENERSAEIKAAGGSTPPVYKLTKDTANATLFHEKMLKSLENNPYAASVYVYDVEEYKEMDLFLADDGMSGVAIHNGNEIVSVFSAPDSKNKKVARHLISVAVANGGTRLDAFDTVLPKIYAAEGFVTKSRLPWNEEFKPKGWDKEVFNNFNGGEPDVVFMEYDESSLNRAYVAGEGDYVEDYDAGLASTSGEASEAGDGQQNFFETADEKSLMDFLNSSDDFTPDGTDTDSDKSLDQKVEEYNAQILSKHALPEGFKVPKAEQYSAEELDAYDPKSGGKHLGGTYDSKTGEMKLVEPEAYVHEFGHAMDHELGIVKNGSKQGTPEFDFWASVKPDFNSSGFTPSEYVAYNYESWVRDTASPEVSAAFDKYFADKDLAPESSPAVQEFEAQDPELVGMKPTAEEADMLADWEAASEQVPDLDANVADLAEKDPDLPPAEELADWEKELLGDWSGDPFGGGADTPSAPEGLSDDDANSALETLQAYTGPSPKYAFKGLPEGHPLKDDDKLSELNAKAKEAFPNVGAKKALENYLAKSLGTYEEKNDESADIEIGSATPKDTKATGMTGGKFSQKDIQEAIDILEKFNGKNFKSELNKNGNPLGILSPNDIVGFDKDKTVVKDKFVALLKTKISKKDRTPESSQETTSNDLGALSKKQISELELGTIATHKNGAILRKSGANEWEAFNPDGEFLTTFDDDSTWASFNTDTWEVGNTNNVTLAGDKDESATPTGPQPGDVVTSVEEIDKLPLGSVLQHTTGGTWEITAPGEVKPLNSSGNSFATTAFGPAISKGWIKVQSLGSVAVENPEESSDATPAEEATPDTPLSKYEDFKKAVSTELAEMPVGTILDVANSGQKIGWVFEKRDDDRWYSLYSDHNYSSNDLHGLESRIHQDPKTYSHEELRNITTDEFDNLPVGQTFYNNLGESFVKLRNLASAQWAWRDKDGNLKYEISRTDALARFTGHDGGHSSVDPTAYDEGQVLTKADIDKLVIGAIVDLDHPNEDKVTPWVKVDVEKWQQYGETNFGTTEGIKTVMDLGGKVTYRKQEDDKALLPIGAKEATEEDLASYSEGTILGEYQITDEGTWSLTETWTKTGDDRWRDATGFEATDEMLADNSDAMYVTDLNKGKNGAKADYINQNELSLYPKGTRFEQYKYGKYEGSYTIKEQGLATNDETGYTTPFYNIGGKIYFSYKPEVDKEYTPATPTDLKKYGPGSEFTIHNGFDNSVYISNITKNEDGKYMTDNGDEVTALLEKQAEHGLVEPHSTPSSGLTTGDTVPSFSVFEAIRPGEKVHYTDNNGDILTYEKVGENNWRDEDGEEGIEDELFTSAVTGKKLTFDDGGDAPVVETEELPESEIDAALAPLPEDQRGESGDGFVVIRRSDGSKKIAWGKYGAGGVATTSTDADGVKRVLVGKRGDRDEWYLPGGAIDENESHIQGAFREFVEEIDGGEGLMDKFRLTGGHRDTIGKVEGTDKDWNYVTVIADIGEPVDIKAPTANEPWELSEYQWFTADELADLQSSGKLHGSLSNDRLAKMVGFVEGDVDGMFDPASPTPETLTYSQDISGWKKVGGSQGGSNPGGVYEDPLGNKYYVKSAGSPEVTQNEVIAAAFYDVLGVRSNKVIQAYNSDTGDDYIATPWIENDASALPNAVKSGDTEFLKKVQDDFAIDAWLGNYDVIGIGPYNLVADADGNPVRIDPGGSMMYRATGGKKSWWSSDPTDIDDMRFGSSKSSAYSSLPDVFGDMTDNDVRESAKKLLDITPAQIRTIVQSSSLSEPAKRELAETLVRRRDAILSRFGLAESAFEGGTSDSPEYESPVHSKGTVVKVKGTGEVFTVELSTNEVSAGKLEDGTMVVYLNDELGDPADEMPEGYLFTSNGEVYSAGDAVTVHDALTDTRTPGTVQSADWNNGLVTVSTSKGFVTTDKGNVAKDVANPAENVKTLGPGFAELPKGSKVLMYNEKFDTYLVEVPSDKSNVPGKPVHGFLQQGFSLDQSLLNYQVDPQLLTGTNSYVPFDVSKHLKPGAELYTAEPEVATDGTVPPVSTGLKDTNGNDIALGDGITITKNNKGGESNKGVAVGVTNGKIKVMRVDEFGEPLLDEGGKKKYSIMDSKNLLRSSGAPKTVDGLPQGITLSNPDPSHPMYGEAKPEKPDLSAPQMVETILSPTWQKKAQVAYEAFLMKEWGSTSGKKLTTAAAWKPALQGDQFSLDHMSEKGYFDSDPALFEELKSALAVQKATYEALMAAHEDRVAAYRAQLKEWSKANGVASYTPLKHSDALGMSNTQAVQWAEKRYEKVLDQVIKGHGPSGYPLHMGLAVQKDSSEWQTKLRTLDAEVGLDVDATFEALPYQWTGGYWDNKNTGSGGHVSTVDVYTSIEEMMDVVGPIGTDVRAIRTVSFDRFVDAAGNRLDDGADLTQLIGTIQKDHGAMEVNLGHSFDHGGSPTFTGYPIRMDLVVPAEVRAMYTAYDDNDVPWQAYESEQGAILEPGLAMYIVDAVFDGSYWRVKASIIPKSAQEYMDNFAGMPTDHNIITGGGVDVASNK